MKIPVYCQIENYNDKKDQGYQYFKFNSYHFDSPIKISLSQKKNSKSDKTVNVYIPYGIINKSPYIGKKELEALCWKDAHGRFYNSTSVSINKESEYFDILENNKKYSLEKNNNSFYISDNVPEPRKFVVNKSDIIDGVSVVDISDNDKCIFLDKFKNMPALSYCIKFKDKDKYQDIYPNHVYSILKDTDQYYELVEVFL